MDLFLLAWLLMFCKLNIYDLCISKINQKSGLAVSIAVYLTALISEVCRKPIEGVSTGLRFVIGREGEVLLRRVGLLS
jgi:hypothetical protein